MNSAVAELPPQAARTRSFSPRVVLLTATLALLWFILCRDLSLEWSSNEQYSYGWFVPFFAAFLFWLRWEEWGKCGMWNAECGIESPRIIGETPAAALRSAFRIPHSAFVAALAALFLLLPTRLFEVANPDWRPLSWMHALVVVGLTLLVIAYWGGRAAVRHFAFPVCFILVAVPWLTPIEAPLVQWLMRIVATVATETLTLFGIPAQLEGSLIRVSNGVVGVSEACSGVRSLQTSLMIGLLFGELKRLTIGRRVALVAAALAIALLANLGRAFFLVWIAAVQNLAAVERWHDIAGYAVVGAVFLGTVAIASALAKIPGSARASRALAGAPPASESEDVARQSLAPPISSSELRAASDPRDSGRHARPYTFVLLTLSWLLLVEASVSAWYRWHENKLIPGRQWTVQWPESAAGFREMPIDEHTREMLRYDTGRQATWIFSPVVRPDAPDAPAVDRAGQAYLFFFRWEPGTATVLRARAHRPDICLPAVGWRQTGEPDIRSYPVGGNFTLPFQHFSFIHDEPGRRPLYAETFFCLREDRVRPNEQGRPDDHTPFSYWTIPERWDVVHKGLRNPGQQVMEVVFLTPNEMSNEAAEAEFAELIRKLVVL